MTYLYRGLLLFLLIQTTLSAQNKRVELKITSSSSNEPVAYANIWFKELNKGVASNLEGEAVLFVPSEVLSDSVVCTFIGYERQLIHVDFEQTTKLDIILTPKYTLLDEVIVTPNAPLAIDARDLIKKALEKKIIEKNYSTIPQNYLIDYREKVKEDGVYVAFNEAIVNFTSEGYPRRVSHKKGFRQYYSEEKKQTLFSKRRQPFNDGLISFNCQFFRYYAGLNERCFIVGARFSDNLSVNSVRVSMAGGALDLLTMDKVKYQYDMLDRKILKKYDFSVSEIISIDGEECYVINFKPILDQSKKKFGIHRRVSDALLAGTIYLHKRDKAIVKFEAQMYSSTIYASRRAWQKWADASSVVVNYKKQIDQKYHLDMITSEQKYLADELHERSYTVQRELKVLELGITIAQTGFIGEFELAHFSHHLSRLITPRYDSAIWKTYEMHKNYPLMDTSLKSDLSVSRSLEEQYFRNSIE